VDFRGRSTKFAADGERAFSLRNVINCLPQELQAQTAAAMRANRGIGHSIGRALRAVKGNK